MSSARGVAWVAVVLAVIESSLAAFTRPFTWQADAVTAVGLAALAVVFVLQLAGRVPAPFARRGPASADARRVVHRFGPHHYGPRAWAAWVVVLSLVVAWEVAGYLSSPRAAHPTLSSMLDTVTSSHAGRGAAFAVWLALGSYLVTR